VVPLAGRVFSWTRTWHDFGTAPELGRPFVSVLVELDGAGGRRVFGTLPGDGKGVRIGATVRGEIIEVAFDGAIIPGLRWHLADAVRSEVAA